MTHSAPHQRPPKAPAWQELHDDNGDTIGPRQYCVDEGLVTSADGGLLQALTTLTPVEIAETLSNRVVIEQATGMLMFVYRTDAEAAHELLKWQAQAASVKLHEFAAQLTANLLETARVDRVSLQEACEHTLMDVPGGFGPSDEGA